MAKKYVIEDGKTRLIMVRERWFESFASDFVSLGGLLGVAVGLNTLMEPSGFINAALALTWFLWMLGRSVNGTRRVTPDEAAEIVAEWQRRPTPTPES